MKKIVAAVVSGALVLGASGLVAMAVDQQNDAQLSALVQEITEQGYSINVAGNQLQLIKDGKIVKFWELKSTRVRLVKNNEGGIAVQFTDKTGKSVKVTLGDQKNVSVSGKLEQLVLSKDLPSTVKVALTEEADIQDVKVQAPVAVTMEKGSSVEKIIVTDKNASVDVAKAASVGKVTTVNKQAVSGVASGKVVTTKQDDRKTIVKDDEKDEYVPGAPIVTPDGKPETPNQPETPEVDKTVKDVSTLDELKTALSDPNVKTINITGGDLLLDAVSDRNDIAINVKKDATLRLPSGKLTGTGVSVNVETGGKMSGYWNIGKDNAVTAKPGADLFWTLQEDTENNLKAGTYYLVSNKDANKSFIKNNGDIVIKGSDSPAGYDIDIAGDATIQPGKAENDNDKTAPLVVDDFKLTVKEGATVTVTGGKATNNPGESTVVVSDKSDSKLIVEGKLKVDNDSEIRSDRGTDGISAKKNEGTKGTIELVEANGDKAAGNIKGGSNDKEITDSNINTLSLEDETVAAPAAEKLEVPSAEENKVPAEKQEAPSTEENKTPAENKESSSVEESKVPAEKSEAPSAEETKSPAENTSTPEEGDKTQSKDPAPSTDSKQETSTPAEKQESNTEKPAENTDKPAEKQEVSTPSTQPTESSGSENPSAPAAPSETTPAE